MRLRRLAVLGTWLAGAAALAHCGADTPSEDAIALPDRPPGSTDASDASDAGVDSSAPVECDLEEPFGAPALVPGLEAGTFAAAPRLSPDELDIYFTTLVANDGAVQADLVHAVRASRGEPFGPPASLATYNTLEHDNDPMVASDRLSLWFSSMRSGNHEIYVARRASATEPLGPAELVAGVGGPTQEMHPYYRPSARELWLTSDRGDSGVDIYVATEQDGSFAAPSLVQSLSSAGVDVQPAVTEDGLAVLLASTRDGGEGGFDLWLARRSSTTEPFPEPAPVVEVNGADDEYAGWLSPDGCRIYFSSNRDTDGGPLHRLWYAARGR